MYHHGQVPRDFLRAFERFEIARARDVERQPRLDADDHVAITRNRLAPRRHVRAIEVHQLAVGQYPRPRKVDEHAPVVRRALRICNYFVDLVRALRSGIDEARHSVGEADRPRILGAGSVGVDVDESRHNELAARIHRFSAVRRDAGGDCRDAAAGDRHVADRVDARRRIDDAPAPDDQIVSRRERGRNAGEHRGACCRRIEKLSPGHHGLSPPCFIPLDGNIVCSNSGRGGPLCQQHRHAMR